MTILGSMFLANGCSVFCMFTVCFLTVFSLLSIVLANKLVHMLSVGLATSQKLSFHVLGIRQRKLSMLSVGPSRPLLMTWNLS